MSRLFVPVREALNVVCVVDCAGEGAGLDEMSPSGRLQCQPAKLRRAVKDGPTGPSAASCEAASLTARNGGATREITRERGSETPARTGRRNGELPTSRLLLGVSAAPLPRHGNHLRSGPPDPDSHLRSCPESPFCALFAACEVVLARTRGLRRGWVKGASARWRSTTPNGDNDHYQS